MSNKQLRTTLRTIHLLASISLLALVYVPVLRNTSEYITLLQLVIIPVTGLSGIAMWQQANITKLRRTWATSKS
jgi:hypothetical protein